MAKEYKIILKKSTKHDAILGRDITTYKFIAKNDKAQGQKTAQLGKCLNASGTEIFTLNDAKGRELKDNKYQLELVKNIKTQHEAARDNINQPLTWSKLVNNITETRQKEVNNSESFYEQIDSVWGIKNQGDKSAFKYLCRETYKHLHTATIKDACSKDTTVNYVKFIEGMASGEVRKRDGKIYSDGQRVKFWSSYKRVVKGLIRYGYIENHYCDIHKPDAEILKRPKPTLKGKATTEELKAIYNANVSYTKNGDAVKKAFLFSALYSGMRLATIHDLKWGNISEEGEFLRFYLESQIKNDFDLEFYVKKDDILMELLGERGKSDQKVFNLPTGTNGKLASDGVGSVFDTIKRVANIDNDKLVPSMCRHTHAYKLLKATNNDLFAVAKKLGHKSIKTTEDNYVRMGKDYYKKIGNKLSKADTFDIPAAL